VERGGDSEAVARGVTLSRGGRVYDYSDATGEVLVYDRTDRTFQILNAARGIRTEATAVEVDRHLAKAREEIAKEAERLRTSNDPAAVRLAARLEIDAGGAEVAVFEDDGRLTVAAGPAKYTVRTASAEAWADRQAAVARVYADFADDVHCLGYVLHPRAVTPDLRMKVNADLRRRSVLPVAVRLETGPDEIAHRAEHVFAMELTDVHRAMIFQWEAMLDDASLRKVPLRTYVKQSHDAKERG
ncbi:MAG: hypothetical protein AAGJ97_15020, partial [Planctomycetota bacterium]